MSSPIPKCMWIDQEETMMAALLELQVTKASEWLEYVSVEESIIQKA